MLCLSLGPVSVQDPVTQSRTQLSQSRTQTLGPELSCLSPELRQVPNWGTTYILYIIWHIIWHIYIYIILHKMRETFFFLKRLHWERKLHFRDCILHVPPYLIALKSFWSTAKRCETNDKISIHNKNSRKKVLRAWIPLQCCFTAYLTVRRIFMANPHGCFPRSYILKTQFIDFLI
jgi:hypothetical protein